MDEFLRHLRAAAISENTITLRRYHLLRISRALDVTLDQATTEDLESYLARPTLSREYRRSLRSTLRQYFTWLQATGRRADNPALGLARIKPLPPAPRPASDIAYQGALRDAQPRERLMLRLAAEAGLRRGEVARLRASDLIDDLLGYSLHVVGKGERERIVPLKDDLAREVKLRAQDRDYLFPGNDNGHLSPGYVGKIISRLLPEGCTMHALRHRFATRVHSATGDLLTTQQLLGHASPATTQLYVLVGQDRLRAAVNAA